MKILLSLPEFPFAHHGGAARSMRTILEFMASYGHSCRAIATTATERKCDTREILSTMKEYRFEILRGGGGYVHRGVFYNIIETGGNTGNWRTPSTEEHFNRAFNYQLEEFRPDILLTYGGYPSDEARYDRAKARGVKLVFGLRNFSYLAGGKGFFKRMDGILTCSRFLTDWYKSRSGIESTPLPLPIQPEDVIPDHREPVYFTMINPARRKGSMLLLTVFRELQHRRPEIPLMIVGESNEPEFLELSQYAKVLPWQTAPKEIYAKTKVLLVPSVWEEPAGRVIAEALLNGIPSITTDRGGMPEVANGGAYVLPLDKRITQEWNQPVPPNVARPWINAVLDLSNCEDFYLIARNATTKMKTPTLMTDAAAIYRPENAAPLYEAYFKNILEAPASTRAVSANSSRTEPIREQEEWI